MLKTFLSALFDSILKWWQGQAEKPKTLEDAQTPKKVKDDWDDYVREHDPELRDQNRNRH